MTNVLAKVAAVFVALLIGVSVWQLWPRSVPDWSVQELASLKALWLESLPPLPADPSNAVADNSVAAALGERLFLDTRLSANGGISCATCHQPIRRFTDGLQKGQAIGTSKRNTPSIVGTAYSPWQYWDGRRDSQWSQALSPLEDENEHAFDRRQVLQVVTDDRGYRETYESLFGALPDVQTAAAEEIDRSFANIGKSIAAFERTLRPTASRFDHYIAAVFASDSEQQYELFNDEEKWGLKLFIGVANCTQCHNGPLMTNNEFHNTGVINYPGETPDAGRIVGIDLVLADTFNCFGEHNDDPTRNCAELSFARTGIDLLGAMRTPSLRNINGTAPYMHKGQLATLADVLRHYNEAPDAMTGHNEAKPLGLSDRELRQLEAFLETLAAPVSGYAN